MSYNRSFRQTVTQPGRYNTPGQFVSAGELGQASPGTPARTTRSSAAAAVTNFSELYPSGNNPPAPPLPPSPAPNTPLMFQPKAQSQQPSFAPSIPAPQPEAAAEVMDTSMDNADGSGSNEAKRHSWMKSKGIKKISNKERRRRQNEHLRRLLTPKNALMVLNEMMPGEQLNNSFTVEPAPASNQFFRQEPGHKFCAGLSVDGNMYKGFGENKLTARNAAAEQAIRDLVIKRMSKVFSPPNPNAMDNTEQNGEDGSNECAAGSVSAEEESETLPMIQLASYALHKLFSEWQYEGFQVPLLQRNTAASAIANEAETLSTTAPKQKPPKKPKELPQEAATMHPCMLLTIMRQGLTYHELGSEGDRPQNMLFTMGVTIDGTTYIGKASNKKEARKLAARSACQAIYDVKFVDATPAPTL